MLFKKYLAGIFAAAVMISGTASADIVTFEFTGTVTDGGALASTGSQIKGRFSYDTKTLPSISGVPGYEYAFYHIPAFKISANVEGHSITAKNFTVGVHDNLGGNVEDLFDIDGSPVQVDNDIYPDGAFAITLASKYDNTGALVGTDLPSSLDLLKFDAWSAGVLLKDRTADSRALLVFSIDSIKAIHERRDSQSTTGAAKAAGK